MQRQFKRFGVVLAICAAFTLLALALQHFGYSPLLEMELYTQDLRTRLGRKTPVDPRLVLIGIDQPAYGSSDFSAEELQRAPILRDLQRNFPWSRVVWAEVTEKLAAAGAKVIAFDLVFSAPNDGDGQLRHTLEKHRDKIVVGCSLSPQKTDRGNVLQLLTPNPAVLPAPDTDAVVRDDRVGFVNLPEDFDGIVRRANFRQTGEQAGFVVSGQEVMESLALRVLRKLGRVDAVPAGFDSVRFRFGNAPGYGYRVHPIGDVLSPKLWERNYGNGEFFRDKIVLVGPTASIFHDEHRTPFGDPKREMLGPELHLNILSAALHGEFLGETSPQGTLGMIGAAGLLALTLGFVIRQPVTRLAVVGALLVGYWFGAQALFSRPGFVIPVAGPVLVLLASSVLVLTYDYVLEQLEKARVRKTLERYVSKDVVKELLDNPATYFDSLVGVRRSVTVLFSDVRGFTTLTESSDSARLVKQLNEYFEEMVRDVFTHQGSLDKFIGDAVMAVWGSIDIVSKGRAHDAQLAVATALAMKRSLRKLNEGWKARGMPELAFGIGINHGEAIVGEIGSSQKVEFTAIGDPVNLASRLEGLTKEYHLDLLLGENLAPLVGEQYILRTVDYVQVKGKTKPVDVFTVVGDGAAQTVSTPVWLARYEEGVRQYRSREFAAAATAFQECLRRQPEDFLSALYAERCQNLIQNPPDESWNGVFVMTKK
ncbi:MAG: adenylate/guanylate cyclase domain-containing protein [Verrucomicrobia bacterium]|nr:adenylate/guanylate cyclase domain-containing protein [Verrucomicrobiota bacterium]